MSLEDIKKEMQAADLPLKEQATQIVFGSGNLQADIVIIGEAPGRREDEQGVPFVGRAGKLLDELLAHIGLKRENIYITNIVKYRPPKNRNPRMSEIRQHTPYLVRQLRAIKPRLILTLGNFSTKFVLAGFDSKKMKNIKGISQLHGTVHEVQLDGQIFKVMPMYHPAAALYRRSLRPQLEEDFEKAKEFI